MPTADEILRFVRFWQAPTGKLPEEVIFDSKLTTYANSNKLNEMGIVETVTTCTNLVQCPVT
jgi:hypothetical protein